jgi:hypothetical protein
MSRPQKTQSSPAGNLAAMSERLDLPTVAAAWPTGISQLALAVDTCQRCDAGEVCTDWLARAPKRIATPRHSVRMPRRWCAPNNQQKNNDPLHRG